MITLRDRCKTESINFAIANFLDDFRANPSVEYIQDSVLDLENLSVVLPESSQPWCLGVSIADTHARRAAEAVLPGDRLPGF